MTICDSDVPVCLVSIRVPRTRSRSSVTFGQVKAIAHWSWSMSAPADGEMRLAIATVGSTTALRAFSWSSSCATFMPTPSHGFWSLGTPSMPWYLSTCFPRNLFNALLASAPVSACRVLPRPLVDGIGIPTTRCQPCPGGDIFGSGRLPRSGSPANQDDQVMVRSPKTLTRKKAGRRENEESEQGFDEKTQACVRCLC